MFVSYQTNKRDKNTIPTIPIAKVMGTNPARVRI